METRKSTNSPRMLRIGKRCGFGIGNFEGNPVGLCGDGYFFDRTAKTNPSRTFHAWNLYVQKVYRFSMNSNMLEKNSRTLRERRYRCARWIYEVFSGFVNGRIHQPEASTYTYFMSPYKRYPVLQSAASELFLSNLNMNSFCVAIWWNEINYVQSAIRAGLKVHQDNLNWGRLREKLFSR